MGAVNTVKEPLTRWTARTTAWTLRLLGANGYASGNFVTSSLYSFRIIFECTAIFPIIIFIAAVLTYPCAWSRKLLGVVLGVPALVAINLVRVVSLFYVGHWFPSAVDALHLLVWQSLMIFCTVALWLLWAGRLAYRESPRS